MGISHLSNSGVWRPIDRYRLRLQPVAHPLGNSAALPCPLRLRRRDSSAFAPLSELKALVAAFSSAYGRRLRLKGQSTTHHSAERGTVYQPADSCAALTYRQPPIAKWGTCTLGSHQLLRTLAV